MPAGPFFRLVVPAIAMNLSQPLVALVDAAIAGHLGYPDALAGVTMGGLLFNLLFWGLGFLRMTATGLVAQAFGTRDFPAIGLIAARVLILCGVFGGLVLAARPGLMPLALEGLGGRGPVLAEAQHYLQARLWSFPLALANACILGVLVGCQAVRAALALQVFSNGANALIAVVWVFGFGGGSAALGTAAALSDLAGSVMAMWLVAGLGIRLRPPSWRALLELEAIGHLLRLHFLLFLRTLALILTFAEFSRLSALQGSVAFAANGLLLNMNTFFGYALDGFAHVTQALVGAAWGAGERPRLVRIVVSGLMYGVGACLCLSGLVGLCGAPILAMLTDLLAVRTEAQIYLVWLSVLPIVSVWSFVLDGVFIGATRASCLLISMAAAAVAFRWVTVDFVTAYGNHGLWLGFVIFMAVRALVLAALFPKWILRGSANRKAGAGSSAVI